MTRFLDEEVRKSVARSGRALALRGIILKLLRDDISSDDQE